jgi:phosphoribosylformimino-5-aminoimidazole carboxamide ribotide isomerase
VYGDDPVAQALCFEAAGAPWIHVVDLDAARTGDPVNRDLVMAIAAAVNVPVQTGGGVRSVSDALTLFEGGVERVVIGTAALADPELVERLAPDHRVAVGLDVRGSEVAVRGWTEGSGRDLHDVADDFAAMGVDALVVTQIVSDGTMQGPDLKGLGDLLGHTRIDVVASGGVGTLDHIRSVATLERAGRRCSGVIVGRALYEGVFTVEQAIGSLDGHDAANSQAGERSPSQP